METELKAQPVGLSALLGRPTDAEMLDWLQSRASEGCVSMCFELDGGVHVTLHPLGGEEKAAREVETVRDGIAALMRPNAEAHPTQTRPEEPLK